MRLQRSFIPSLVLVLCVLVPCIVGPPVIPEEAKEPRKKNNKKMDLGLDYERYLKEVIESLEEDKAFRDKLGSAKMEDITSGKIANELQFVSHHIRSKLDELKRNEMTRLRRLARQENELSNGIDRRTVGMPLHLDVKNEHTFEIKDLRRLVRQTTKDLEEIDRQRRDEFKGYEMEKEHRRREELAKLDEEKRKLAEKEYLEKQKRHKEHPKLHHPGSKQQLEEVWEQEDQMPTEEFDPKTFFRMHDLDGDEYWSEDEVKSLFTHELNKMYDSNNTDDDMQERREEMDRMREHVVNETDTDSDGLISMREFMEMTRRNEFNQDQGWQGLDETEMYREDEFREYERQYQAGLIPPGGVPVYLPDGVHPGAGYQHLPPNPQMYPPHQQQGYPQPVPPGPYDHQYQQGYPQGQQGYPQGQQGYPQGQMHQQQEYHQGQPQYQEGNHQGQVPQQQGYPQGQHQQQGYPQGQIHQQQGFPQGQPGHPQGQVPQQQGYPQGQVPHQQGYPQGQVPQQHGYPQGQVPQQQKPSAGQPPQKPLEPQQGLPQQPQQANLPNPQVPQQASSEHPPKSAEPPSANQV